ncbi:MAG TPA: Xaa-Pro peptidase family protein [Candidatus Krumholzibacteria bacterium]|nr:Xaa-Pro peptidase family protein [Candidatus Krumholzibacteria bacterium]
MARASARPSTILLYAASDNDADSLYATRFFAPDPFVFLRTGAGRRILVMSDLEIDRAKRQSNAHRVLSFARYAALAEKRWKRTPHAADTIAEVLRALRIGSVTVPASFPSGVTERLRKRRIAVYVADGPLFPERARKSAAEVKAIRDAMRATEAGMQAAVDTLRRARVRKGWVVLDGRRLTAEDLRRAADTTILAHGCLPAHTIVAPGRQGCDPHDEGSGPIRAGVPIIVDIFPRAQKNGYFADITRTFVKGRASKTVRAMYDAVHDGQRLALRSIRHGARVRDIHDAIHALFAARGFQSGKIDGRMQGFFHGTGHGLGLEIHEPPRVAANDAVLEAGMVVTVEPGLYYWPHGGVRIEDTVLVTRRGITNLTRFPKFFEIP